MELRELGKSGVKVPPVGLGCWAIGGWRWGGTDVSQSIATIQRAIDLGMTLLDTAPVYGWGLSEEILGRALEGRRDHAIIATKCGLVWDCEEGQFHFESEGRRVFRNSRKERIFADVEASLRRLRTDRIDLYQIHWPDETTPFEETMEALTALREAGKIRAVGVSNFTVEQHLECLRYGVVDSSQPRYNMLDRKAEKSVLPFCRKRRIGVLVYSPMEQGLLTGRVTLERTFPEGDYRAQRPWFQPHNRRRILEFLERVRPIAEGHGKSLAHLAIAWVLSQPGVTAALVGARRPEQVEHNIEAAQWRLSAEELAKIDEELAWLGKPQ